MSTPFETASVVSADMIKIMRSGDGDDSARNELPAVIQEVIHTEGDAPKTTFDGETQASATIWVFRTGVTPRKIQAQDLATVIADENNVVWVDICAYTADVVSQLARTLRLHRVAVHAALSSWRRPHVDIYPDQVFVSATIARVEGKSRRVYAGQLDLFVGHNFLVSMHKLPLPFADELQQRALLNPDFAAQHTSFLLYLLLDELLGYYQTLNEHLQTELEHMEERALIDNSDHYLEELLRFKRYTFALSQLVDHHQDVFATFLRPDFQLTTGEDIDVYFRDLDARLARLSDDLASFREAINGAFDIYVSQMSHRTNSIIKVLTMVSSILLPLTVIIGIFGTSIQGLPLYHPQGFFIMLALMICVSLGILLAFRWRRWL